MKWRIRRLLVLVCLTAVGAIGIHADRPRDTRPPMQNAIFAAGCFWGVEHAFRKIPGVIATRVGYTGGWTSHPTYQDVSHGNTGHVEAVEVTFDPRQVGYAELLDVFWSCHDPTSDQRGGPHESIIFVENARQESIARASKDEVTRSNLFKRPILTRIVPASQFFRAEEYHQQYMESHGAAVACHLGPITVRTHLAARSIPQQP